MYDAVKDDINPYIKAIDSTYLGLTWDTAFAVSLPIQTFSGLVKSVKATPYYGSERDVNPRLIMAGSKWESCLLQRLMINTKTLDNKNAF